jgi:hypothetical protein
MELRLPVISGTVGIGAAGSERNTNQPVMNEYTIGLSLLILVGFLSVISEIRTTRKRLESAIERVESVMAEIRDSLKK